MCRSVGHYFYRDYFYSRPPLKKLIISSGLILLSFGIEIASFMVMLTNCLRYFAADATADIILLYPKLTCSILTIMDYFSFIWLGVSLATLVFFRALREYQPNIYISMNHDRLSLVLNLGSLVLIASAILVQVTWCQHICRAGMFVNYYYELRGTSSHNMTVTPDLGDGQACWIPTVEITTMLVIFLGSIQVLFSLGKSISRLIMAKDVMKKRTLFHDTKVSDAGVVGENTEVLEDLELSSREMRNRPSTCVVPLEFIAEDQNLARHEEDDDSNMWSRMPEVACILVGVVLLWLIYQNQEACQISSTATMGIKLFKKAAYLAICFCTWIFVLHFDDIKIRIQRKLGRRSPINN